MTETRFEIECAELPPLSKAKPTNGVNRMLSNDVSDAVRKETRAYLGRIVKTTAAILGVTSLAAIIGLFVATWSVARDAAISAAELEVNREIGSRTAEIDSLRGMLIASVKNANKDALDVSKKFAVSAEKIRNLSKETEGQEKYLRDLRESMSQVNMAKLRVLITEMNRYPNTPELSKPRAKVFAIPDRFASSLRLANTPDSLAFIYSDEIISLDILQSSTALFFVQGHIASPAKVNPPAPNAWAHLSCALDSSVQHFIHHDGATGAEHRTFGGALVHFHPDPKQSFVLSQCIPKLKPGIYKVSIALQTNFLGVPNAWNVNGVRGAIVVLPIAD